MSTTLATSNALALHALPRQGAMRFVLMALMAIAGSLVLWVSAKTHVPFYPVPMTLQTLAIVVIAAVYGWKLGLATIIVYLAEGAFGLPVFSGTPERGIGLVYMTGPTAGYLAGFIVATLFVGFFAERGADRSALRLFPVMLIGAAIILALGFGYLSSVIGVEKAFAAGVVPFVLGDLFKVAIGALLVPAASRLIRR